MVLASSFTNILMFALELNFVGARAVGVNCCKINEIQVQEYKWIEFNQIKHTQQALMWVGSWRQSAPFIIYTRFEENKSHPQPFNQRFALLGYKQPKVYTVQNNNDLHTYLRVWAEQ